MPYVRPILTVLAFGLAASGSIWVGWIYAGSHPRVEKPTNTIVNAGPSRLRPARSGEVGQTPGFMSLPDLSSMNVMPGAAGSSDNVSELNGFPTVSKEAIERAAGYSDRDLPEVEMPFSFEAGKNFGDSSDDDGGIP